MRENLALKLPELATRFEPELVGQQHSSSLVGVERVGLTAGAIERKHELGTEVFAERMLVHERLEFADDRRVATGREVGLDPQLHARESELFESSDLGLGEWLVCELRERSPAPEPHRISERSVRDEPLEAVEIELASFDAQLVAGRSGHDPLAPECASQLRDVDLERLRRRCGWALAPERANQRIGGNDAIRTQQENGQ